MTVNSDPMVFNVDVPAHIIFSFVGVEDVTLKNSYFVGNQNFVIFHLYSIWRNNFFDTLNLTTLKFDNITILNNKANNQAPNTIAYSFFSIFSTLKDVDITLQNSYFQSNTVGKNSL